MQIAPLLRMLAGQQCLKRYIKPYHSDPLCMAEHIVGCLRILGNISFSTGAHIPAYGQRPSHQHNFADLPGDTGIALQRCRKVSQRPCRDINKVFTIAVGRFNDEINCICGLGMPQGLRYLRLANAILPMDKS